MASDSQPQDGIDPRFQAYRDTGDRDLRNVLVTDHQPLAKALARRYTNRGVAREDLEQVASLALVRAVERFDPDVGVRFSTFASRTIDGELKRFFRDRAWAVRVPRGAQELGIAIRRAVDELSQEHGRSPTVDELAERLGAARDEVIEAMETSAAYRADSLDTPQGSAALLGGEDDGLAATESRATVSRLLAELEPRARRIVELRFFADKSQREIAAELGISQMHVSRLLRRALNDLRSELGP